MVRALLSQGRLKLTGHGNNSVTGFFYLTKQGKITSRLCYLHCPLVTYKTLYIRLKLANLDDSLESKALISDGEAKVLET